MDRKQMLQVLVPAGGAALVVLLVGVLVMMGGEPAAPTAKGTPGKPAPVAVAGDDTGMSDSLPPVDAPDWKPAAGGMKEWDVKEGTGDACPVGATVVIHYTGWTLDGKEFDSSRKRGQPAEFPLGNLIKGWQEGIPGMKPGGIRRLVIPYEWAYGAAGKPPTIPPKATLVFEVKYLGAR